MVLKDSFTFSNNLTLEDSFMERLMTYKEVATQLDLSERFIAKLVGLGEIPYVKIGKSVRFNPNKIKEWVDKKSNTASGHAPAVSMRSKLTIVKATQGVA
jgi:excisionase family DNA binding protein